MSVEGAVRSMRGEVEEALEDLLPPAEGHARTLRAAMRHAVLGGGKRVRALLAIAACEACGGARRAILAPAAALEMIHAYSLVHDDLPAMDDDDLRRGRPTVHRAFGEAAAILAGDALLTLAFEILALEPAGADAAARRAEAVAAAARASGYAGMVGGQMGDLEAAGTAIDAERLRWIHAHKTGALLRASLEIGAIHADASPPLRRALSRFGEQVGLAFQIADDILDVTSTREALGKTPGKDRKAAKATYPALLGLEAARAEAARLVTEGSELLSAARIGTPVLLHLARFAVSRAH